MSDVKPKMLSAESELIACIRNAIRRTESELLKWGGGNTQFEASRFRLGGQIMALKAVLTALETGNLGRLIDL